MLRRGDTLVVKSPDRLARNTVDLLNIAHELRDKGVDLEFLDTPALNVDSATGTTRISPSPHGSEAARVLALWGTER